MLDTNVASHILRRDLPAIEKRLKLLLPELTVISVVTEAELRYGIERRLNASRLKRIVEDFLNHVEILFWDSSAARAFARLRTQLEAGGSTLHSLDMMIAAHALSTGCVLVTLDKALLRVPHLKAQDWSSRSAATYAIRSRDA